MDYLRLFSTENEYDLTVEDFEYPTVSYVTDTDKVYYMEKPPYDYSKDYLTFEALEDGTFTLSVPANVDSTYMTSISYSTDNGETWNRTNNTSSDVTITTSTIAAGNKVLWKGVGRQTAKSISSYNASIFSATGNFNVYGNIMSLLNGDNFANQTTFKSGSTYNFASLFRGNTNLISAENLILPVTTLTSNCYSDMFYGCTSLTIPPALPATTLAYECYSEMFYATNVLPDCSNIDFTSSTVIASSGLRALFKGTKVTYNDLMGILPKDGNNKPCLPVDILTERCYVAMFSECTSLTTAPELPATTLASYCYQNMFYHCTALTVPPELPATTLAAGCYTQMFEGCTSLATAPVLPAETMVTGCYYGMFRSCAMTTAPALPAMTLASTCYNAMFSGCTSLTTPPALPATTLATQCYGSMFYECKALTTAPELPATTLVSKCYQYMFYGCSKLNYIKAMFTTTPSTSYTQNWVQGVASTGTFIKNSAATWNVTGSNGIPTGWTVETASA